MKISTGMTIDGNRLFIVYDEDENYRLIKTCFHGTRRKLAGNFSQWNSFEDVVTDRRFNFNAEILKSAERTYRKCLGKKKLSAIDAISLDFEDNIGWESTDDQKKYNDGDLEEFKPNDRCVVLRVKTDLTHIEAPKTSLMTIVYGITTEGSDITVYIKTIYPGVYFGPLYNTEGDGDVNITERQEGRVFFSSEHPGE